MGNIIKNWVKRQQVGGGGKKAVLLCLADAAFDNERGKVVLTQSIIADTIEFDRRSVIRWIDQLEGEFITKVKSKKADGTNNPNEYKILCPAEIFEINDAEDEDQEFVLCLTPDCDIPILASENYCFECSKEPSDTQSHSNPDLVTHSHYLSDTQSPITPENGENQPNLVTESHIEPSDTVSHITLLKEEELLREEVSYETSFVRLAANDGDLRKLICQKNGSKPKVREITADEWKSIVEIFEFWKLTFNKNGQTRLNDERGRAVLDRLRSIQGYTVEEIKTAIRGCRASPNHNGAKGTVYDDLEMICRHDGQLDKMIGYSEAAVILNQNGGTNAIATQNNFKTAADKRDERAITEYQFNESVRARVEARRRQEKL